MSVRIARLQQGIHAALAGVADLVAWGHQNQERGDNAGSILSMRLESSDSRVVAKRFMFPVEYVEFVIDDATENNLALARVNGLEVHHDIGAAETLETVRDAMLAELATLEPGRFTAADVSTDRISLSADVPGGLWSVLRVGSVQLDEGSLVMATEAVEVIQLRETYQLVLEAYSGETEPRLGAHAIISEARSRLEDDDLLVELGRFGVKRWAIEESTDLSAIAGAYWESRVRLPVQIAIRNVRVVDKARIEDATFDLTAALA